MYTATFTATADGATTIDVAGGGFSDAVGNTNTAATQFNWVQDDTGPTKTITASQGADGFTSNDATLSLTFTSNEATTNFAVGDISVSNGALSSIAQTSSTVYTATFTPTTDGATTIDVGANGYTDAPGNNNAAATQFNWLYDSTDPTVSITTIATDGYVSSSERANGFTITGASTGANGQDVVVTYGGVTDSDTVTVANGAWTVTMCDDED